LTFGQVMAFWSALVAMKDRNAEVLAASTVRPSARL
jgi:hypothetical protein